MYFEGVLPALLTPFDESGAVDSAALARNAEWLKMNLSGSSAESSRSLSFMIRS